MTEPDLTGRRFRSCVEAFGEEGVYDPACCRWPKSCSPYPYPEAIAAGNVKEEDLEPVAALPAPARALLASVTGRDLAATLSPELIRPGLSPSEENPVDENEDYTPTVSVTLRVTVPAEEVQPVIARLSATLSALITEGGEGGGPLSFSTVSLYADVDTPDAEGE